ncbi:MAG: hypothetical protein ACK4UK_04385, partial [Flavobacterium sp.]
IFLVVLLHNMKIMKRLLPFLFIAFILMGCGKRESMQMLSSGNYDGAIQFAVSSLRTNKNAKGKQDFVYILEEAYAKAKERDERNISLWSKEANPANLEQIFNAYQRLNQRQELIRPLLPLRLLKEGSNAIFPLEDYSTEIIDSKNAYSNYLYNNVKERIQGAGKLESRELFNDLVYLNQINPGFKNTAALMEEAKNKGTDFVHVYTKNDTQMIIPVRLENDLLDFSTYGLNDQWTVFHNNRRQGIHYDFGVIVNFRDINISPEQIREKQVIQEKQVKDGTQNLLDSNGNVVKDSLGKTIKVDKFKTVKATVYQFQQFKAAQVTAKVDYIDFNDHQLLSTFPLISEFVFEHYYATLRGDRRACDDIYLTYLNNRALPFPSHEQMVFDTGEDLKNKLRIILSRNRFRR